MLLSLLRNMTLSFVIVATITCTSALAGDKAFSNTSASGVLYEITFGTAALEAMKPLPARIRVTGPNGGPLSGARITCSLTMPAMAMSRNTPTIKESSVAGQYESIFLITMGGLWEVELTTVYASGDKETVVIPIYGVNAESTDNNVDKKLEDLFQEKKATQN